MKKFNVSIFAILLFSLTSFNTPKLTLEDERFEWSVPVCISDSGYTPFSGPIFSVINSNNIIFAYTESPFLPPDYKNINVYVRELRNGILSDTINLTNSIYNSYWPVIKTDRKGITHLIWGISLTTPSAFSLIHPTDVYYSFYNNGVWSAPENIFHKDPIANSNAYSNGKLELDSRNRLHLLWVINDPITGLRFYHKIEENCLWGEIKEIPFRTADYDFIFDKNDRLHLAYFRPEYSGGYDENSVYYRFSDDYGESWSDSVLVHKSGSQRGIKVQILSDQKNNIHIIWTKHLTGNKTGGDAIYHSYSPDGATWTEPKNAVPQSVDGFLYFSAAMDKNNKIHLVYDLWSGLFLIPVKLCYTCWDGTSWSVPEDIVDSAEWPSIELDSLGYLHLEYADAMKGSKYYTKTTMPLIVKVDEKKNNIPQEYELNQNYPNPFNPTTTINYQLPENGFVTIKVYDMLGKEVSTLVNENKSAGYYKVNFGASKLTSGVYVYIINANNFVQSKKMLLMK
jgi:hypothetical protein